MQGPPLLGTSAPLPCVAIGSQSSAQPVLPQNPPGPTLLLTAWPFKDNFVARESCSCPQWWWAPAPLHTGLWLQGLPADPVVRFGCASLPVSLGKGSHAALVQEAHLLSGSQHLLDQGPWGTPLDSHRGYLPATSSVPSKNIFYQQEESGVGGGKVCSSPAQDSATCHHHPRNEKQGEAWWRQPYHWAPHSQCPLQAIPRCKKEPSGTSLFTHCGLCFSTPDIKTGGGHPGVEVAQLAMQRALWGGFASYRDQ